MTVPSTNGVGKTGQQQETLMELDHFLTIYTKSNSKWDERPKCETGNHQNPRGNHRQQTLWARSEQLLPGHVPDARETKAKMNYWDLKINSFCTAKTQSTKLKGNWQNRRRYLQMASDKGLVSKIYKELLKLDTEKTNNLVKKWSEDMNRHFSKKTSRWRKDTCNEAHCHSLSGNINQNHNETTPHTCQDG